MSDATENLIAILDDTLLTSVLACPESGEPLREVRCGDSSVGLFCEASSLFYPIQDGIPILLPLRARNSELEMPLLLRAREQLGTDNPAMLACLSNTIDHLESRAGEKSWEWEDEEFWSHEYAQRAETEATKNWNDRIWQREFLAENLLSRCSLTSKVILSVGCGEGQNFRNLLASHCDASTLYIAADISFEGLRLNRKLNPHSRCLYILCSADQLPFRPETIDVLCYFGILHHTERKSLTLSQDAGLLRPGGFIVLQEVLARPTISSTVPRLRQPGEVSAHEEQVELGELQGVIQGDSRLQVESSRQMRTVFLGGMMRFFPKLMVKNRTFFRTVSAFDRGLIHLFGRIFPFFRPGEIQLVIRKL